MRGGWACNGSAFLNQISTGAFNQAIHAYSMRMKDPRNKFLVYAHAKGGFGSRMWGMANTFLWALLTNRTLVSTLVAPNAQPI